MHFSKRRLLLSYFETILETAFSPIFVLVILNEYPRLNELIPFIATLLSENVSKIKHILIGVHSSGGGGPAEIIIPRIMSSSTRLPVARQLTTIKILLSIKYSFFEGGGDEYG